MSNESDCKIAVVGGGFSGVMTAVHLVRLGARKGIQVILLERNSRPARGVAFGTSCDAHLLNVPAGNMSALPDQPLDFVKWAQRRDASVQESSFLPRSWYGDYLHDILWEHMQQFDLSVIQGEVMDVGESSEHVTLHLRSGQSLAASRVVLAAGNYLPRNPSFLGSQLLSSPRYVRNPGSRSALMQVAPNDTVMLVGTGLTAIDVALQLQSQGHCGVIHAVSRHGLLPHAHRAAGKQRRTSTPREFFSAPRTAIGLLRAFRAAVRRMEAKGFDWRDVVTSTRSITQELWKSLDSKERSRFLRHLRTYWDIHRHRVAPQVAAMLEQLCSDGKLNIHAARVATVESNGSALKVTLRPRGSDDPRLIKVNWIINCTGPDSDVRQISDPLWSSLLHRGLAQPDDQQLGVLTSNDGALLDESGRPSDRVFVVGPLRKAQLWESTAVPELRNQAWEVARNLLRGKPAACDTNHDEIKKTVASTNLWLRRAS